MHKRLEKFQIFDRKKPSIHPSQNSLNTHEPYVAAKVQLEKVICHLQLSDSIQTFSTSYRSDGGVAGDPKKSED